MSQQMNSLRSVVQERDIDILLLEEFHSSEAFQQWFLENTVETILHNSKFCGCWHSVIHYTGESDLEIDFLDFEGKCWRLLIENKIGAAFQVDQAKRYIQRGEAYLNAKICHEFRTVIIAPENYFKSQTDWRIFHFAVTYEKLSDWFRNASELGKRAKFKAKMIDIAIEQQRRGYQANPHEIATQNWQLCYEWVQEIAPELGMIKPDKPKTSGTFITLKPSKVYPRELEIIHKSTAGYVDLQFPGNARSDAEFEKFRTHCFQLLEPGMTIEKAGNSAAIRIFVPVIDVTKEFGEQESSVIEGIWAAKKLLQWARKHNDQINR
jgi:hypothetical protein